MSWRKAKLAFQRGQSCSAMCLDIWHGEGLLFKTVTTNKAAGMLTGESGEAYWPYLDQHFSKLRLLGRRKSSLGILNVFPDCLMSQILFTKDL